MTLKSSTGSGRAVPSVALASETSTRWTMTLVRSMWLRNWMPRPAPRCAPSMRPGRSATVKDSVVGKVADLDDAEVGLEGGEGVVGDLGAGGGEARDERGFADVGVADEAGVGEETEFEAVVALFAGAAEFVLARGLVGAGGEVLVAASAASAAGDDDGLVGVGEVVDELAGVVVVEEGADGDFEGGGLAGWPEQLEPRPWPPRSDFVLGVEAEVDEGVVAERGGHEDVAAVAAVAAGGAAAGDEFFAAEGHAAVAAVAGFDADLRFINEHAVSSVLGWHGPQLLILLDDWRA